VKTSFQFKKNKEKFVKKVSKGENKMESVIVFAAVFVGVIIVIGILGACWKIGKKIAEDD